MNTPEVALEVLARLPLESIARCRSVRKEWKILIDSDFFRDFFISLNSSSVAWSIIQMRPRKLSLEIVGHHGCKTWGLTRSPGSLPTFFAETTIRKILVLACTDGLVFIYVEASDGTPMFYVGNPLFQEWVRIPLPPLFRLEFIVRLTNSFSDCGLVTKMLNGTVVSYKVVWAYARDDGIVDFKIFSSDTGEWDFQHAAYPNFTFCCSRFKSIALNGILHWLSNDTSSFAAYDFYGGHDVALHILSFPDSGKDYELPRFKRTFSTSEGSIVYFNEYGGNGNRILRIWRLVKYIDGPEAWQLFWEVNLVSLIGLDIDCFPVVMHPLNSEIIYLWSRNKKGMVLFNLRTKVSSLHRESEDVRKCMDGCVLSFNSCSKYMEKIYRHLLPSSAGGPNFLFASQYVLPRWLHRLPRPPPS